MKTFFKTFLTLMIVLSTSLVFSQDKPSELQYLVGARGRDIENTLKQRGYVHIKTSKDSHNSWSYWWNNNKRQCLSTKISDGKVENIMNIGSADCNKPLNSDDNHHSYNHYSHQSHHHTNSTHYSTKSLENAFEHGFKDGLYHKSYHNYYLSGDQARIAYSEGFTAGTYQRNHHTSHHSGYGGYSSYVYVNDIIGGDALDAYSKLKSRGFRLVKGGDKYKVWHNEKTNQCVKTVSIEKRIYDVLKSTHCTN